MTKVSTSKAKYTTARNSTKKVRRLKMRRQERNEKFNYVDHICVIFIVMLHGKQFYGIFSTSKSPTIVKKLTVIS